MIKVNGKSLDLEYYPNKEMQVKTSQLNTLVSETDININFKFETNEDILHLYFVLNHISIVNSSARKHILFYYMPYSRMDRNENGNCFTLLHIINLINGLLSSKDDIRIIEPHSDVSLQVENSSKVDIIAPLMGHILEENPNINVICYPDKGAKARFIEDNTDLSVIYCNKKRDFNTGKILSLELENKTDLIGKNVLILDDLCSRGDTSLYTAQRLKESGANEIYLGVCHIEPTIKNGKIFSSKCFGNKSIINHIYGFDTMLPEEEAAWLQTLGKNITIYKMDKYLENSEFVDYSKKVLTQA